MVSLYFAYGSNLNIRQMQARCPNSEPVAPYVLKNFVLRFRGVADIAKMRGAEVHGGIWTITEECEEALDRYEGVSGGLYMKRYFTLTVEDGTRYRVLYYTMNSRGIMPPSEYYLQTIIRGYRDFNLDLGRLNRAVEHSWNRKNKTPRLRKRHIAKGKPKLGRMMIQPAA